MCHLGFYLDFWKLSCTTTGNNYKTVRYNNRIFKRLPSENFLKTRHFTQMKNTIAKM